MTRVLKEIIVNDPRGKILSRTLEHLADDGSGATRLIRTTTAGRCTGCGHPLLAGDQLSGYCGWCGGGPVCRACETSCQICRRRLCLRCRRGFAWGRTPVVACPSCLRRLNRRALHDQVIAAKKAAIQMALLRQRLRERSFTQRMGLVRTGSSNQGQSPRRRR